MGERLPFVGLLGGQIPAKAKWKVWEFFFSYLYHYVEGPFLEENEAYTFTYLVCGVVPTLGQTMSRCWEFVELSCLDEAGEYLMMHFLITEINLLWMLCGVSHTFFNRRNLAN